MKTLREHTVGLRAHIYLVNNDKSKVLAYRRDDGEINVFFKPLAFSTKFRKFEKVVDTELERAYTSSIS